MPKNYNYKAARLYFYQYILTPKVLHANPLFSKYQLFRAALTDDEVVDKMLKDSRYLRIAGNTKPSKTPEVKYESANSLNPSNVKATVEGAANSVYNNYLTTVKNWDDLSNSQTFEQAYKNARSKGYKNFIYNNHRYNTDYIGEHGKIYELDKKNGLVDKWYKQYPNFTYPELVKEKQEELNTYGITNELTNNRNWLDNRFLNVPAKGYDIDLASGAILHGYKNPYEEGISDKEALKRMQAYYPDYFKNIQTEFNHGIGRLYGGAAKITNNADSIIEAHYSLPYSDRLQQARDSLQKYYDIGDKIPLGPLRDMFYKLNMPLFRKYGNMALLNAALRDETLANNAEHVEDDKRLLEQYKLHLEQIGDPELHRTELNYLFGVPQKDGKLSISLYKPTNGGNYDYYYTTPQYARENFFMPIDVYEKASKYKYNYGRERNFLDNYSTTNEDGSITPNYDQLGKYGLDTSEGGLYITDYSKFKNAPTYVQNAVYLTGIVGNNRTPMSSFIWDTMRNSSNKPKNIQIVENGYYTDPSYLPGKIFKKLSGGPSKDSLNNAKGIDTDNVRLKMKPINGNSEVLWDLGSYTMPISRDWFGVYDNWNINPFGAGNDKPIINFGNSIPIYDRFYLPEKLPDILKLYLLFKQTNE